MKRAIKAAIILLLVAIARAQQPEIPLQISGDEIHLRAIVNAVVPLSDFSGEITPVDVDPRFALTLRIESADPAIKELRSQSVVTLAIHSPSLLFTGEPKKGAAYNFTLHRVVGDGKVRFFGLGVPTFAQHLRETRKEPVLIKLSQPVYPPLARTANIWGDVTVTMSVHPDGSSEAVVVSGHPMLKQAALDSAIQSKFGCSGCVGIVKYTLVYSFKQTQEGNCCDASSVSPKVERLAETADEEGTPQTHVIIAAQHGCLCDPTTVAIKTRTRSAKQPEAFVRSFYDLVVARHPVSIPDAPELKVFAPYLSKALLKRIHVARACSVDWERQNPPPPILKPPFGWLESGLFSGGNEKASPRLYHIDKSQLEKDGSFRVYVTLTYGLPENPWIWQVAAIVMKENGRFVVDDVIYLKDGPEASEWRLSESLTKGCVGTRWVGDSDIDSCR